MAIFEAVSPSAFALWTQGDAPLAGVGKLVKFFPKPAPTTAPQYTPDSVKRFYMQGMDNLSANFDAAGTMFRKSLDTALKHLDPLGRGTLQQRIDNLNPSIGVTQTMQAWAHEIRRLGNDAAHEDDPFSEEEAQALQSFTEMFLTYAFTLPGMLAVRHKTTASSSAPSTP